MLVYFRLAAAILPAALLLLLVYKRDKNGKEPKDLLWRLIFAGGIIIIPIYIYELVGQLVIEFGNAVLTGGLELGFAANFFVYFGVVAFAEEGFKMIALATQTWKNPNFNFKYDGIVYAVFVGMGFAIFENIKYVLEYGLGTGVLRALTAIPGHCAFAIIMGTFYGSSKYFQSIKNKKMQVICMFYAIVIPIVGHGLYDFALTVSNSALSIVVSIIYMIILDIFALVLLLYQSKHDQYILGTKKPILQNQAQQPRMNMQPGAPMYNGYINATEYSNYINPTNVVPNMYNPTDFRRQ
ncbi:MAG TPA: PrsW family intramembrane metalloprotease [Methanosphaera sp.]|nr:PrsW family intramembrane metalloprotease [Methanosphaera sp.]